MAPELTNMMPELTSSDPLIVAISLIGNIITIIGAFIACCIRLFKKKQIGPYNLSRFSFITLKYRLSKAYKKEDGNEIKLCLKYIYLKKLYSKDTYKQNTAINEMMQSDDTNQTFQMFVERAGSEPKLSSAVKPLLIERIKELSKRM